MSVQIVAAVAGADRESLSLGNIAWHRMLQTTLSLDWSQSGTCERAHFLPHTSEGESAVLKPIIVEVTLVCASVCACVPVAR